MPSELSGAAPQGAGHEGRGRDEGKEGRDVKDKGDSHLTRTPATPTPGSLETRQEHSRPGWETVSSPAEPLNKKSGRFPVQRMRSSPETYFPFKRLSGETLKAFFRGKLSVFCQMFNFLQHAESRCPCRGRPQASAGVAAGSVSPFLWTTGGNEGKSGARNI